MAQPPIQTKIPKTVKLINQGTFGCVFRPGIKCGTKTADSEKYITKVQVNADEVHRETEIGKIVTTIPRYKYRFAPIIEACPIDVSTIGSTEISKCEVITKSINKQSHPSFISNKIKYVGKYTLGDYLDRLITSSSSTSSKSVDNYFKELIDIHIYLLQSLQLLVNANIIHYDLKENNIMFDETHAVPIIIDFGLSFQINKLTEANYADAFYTLYAQYTCWCVEITLLCYIIKRVYKDNIEPLTAKIKKAAIDDVKKHVLIYITENEALKNGITENEKKLFKLKINSFIYSFHEKTWKQFMDALITTYKSWDNYSLAVILIREMSYVGVLQEPNINFLQEYIKCLKAVILAPPTQRQEIPVTIGTIKDIFAKVNKTEYATFKKITSNSLKKVDKVKKIKQLRHENTLTQLLQDDELKKRKH